MNLKELIFGGGVSGVSDRTGTYAGSIQAWLPVKDILQGTVITRDKRFIKILELLPVNFYTMSELEKGSAVADLAAYLKIAPANLQINVLTQKFDLQRYLHRLREALAREGNERCREMLEESISYVPQLVEREAITHRFFLSFSYDSSMKAADNTPAGAGAFGMSAACRRFGNGGAYAPDHRKGHHAGKSRSSPSPVTAGARPMRATMLSAFPDLKVPEGIRLCPGSPRVEKRVKCLVSYYDPDAMYAEILKVNDSPENRDYLAGLSEH